MAALYIKSGADISSVSHNSVRPIEAPAGSRSTTKEACIIEKLRGSEIDTLIENSI
jgi:hypothetical protein